MSNDPATGSVRLAGPETLTNDLRRVGLVGTVALAALAVIGLAWAATPTTANSTSTGALGIGAVGVLSLSLVTLGAAYRRTHTQLAGHAEIFEEGMTSAAGREVGLVAMGEDLDERVSALEDRLGTVEQMQNDHLVELIEATDPPTTGERVRRQG